LGDDFLGVRQLAATFVTILKDKPKLLDNIPRHTYQAACQPKAKPEATGG